MHVLFIYLEDVTASPPGHRLSTEVWEAAFGLADLGPQVTVLTLGSEEQTAQRLSGQMLRLPARPLRVIPMTRLKEMRHQALLQSNLSLLAQMACLHRQGRRVDLVHCFGWQAGLASGLISQLTGAPLVCTLEDEIVERGPWMSDPQLAYPRCVERWLIRRSRRLLCPDPYARGKIQDLFLVKDEDLCVVAPVSARIHDNGERDIVPQEIEPSILYVGPLNYGSGVDTLLLACSRLVARRAPLLRLLLVASAATPDDLMIRKMIRELQLAEHVRLLNDIDGGRLPEEIFQQASLLVMPGRAEFVGNVILEAMGAGLPVVAANCGALAELIEDGVNGLKFSHCEVESLAQAMETILFDPQLYRQLALEARREVRRRPEVGPLLMSIYQELWAGLKGKPEGKGGDIDDLLFAKTRGGGGI